MRSRGGIAALYWHHQHQQQARVAPHTLPHRDVLVTAELAEICPLHYREKSRADISSLKRAAAANAAGNLGGKETHTHGCAPMMFRRNGNRWGVQKQFGPFLRFPYAGPRVGIVLNNRGHNHFHGVVCARTRRIQYGELNTALCMKTVFPQSTGTDSPKGPSRVQVTGRLHRTVNRSLVTNLNNVVQRPWDGRGYHDFWQCKHWHVSPSHMRLTIAHWDNCTRRTY